MNEAEKAKVHGVLNSERFCDSSPRQVYATLLDEDGVYLCHWRTMYTILNEHDEVQERRRQRRHVKRVKLLLCHMARSAVMPHRGLKKCLRTG
jgi:putative transposase